MLLLWLIVTYKGAHTLSTQKPPILKWNFKSWRKGKLLFFHSACMYQRSAVGYCTEQGIMYLEVKIAQRQWWDAVVRARYTQAKKANITLAHKDSEKCIIWDLQYRRAREQVEDHNTSQNFLLCFLTPHVQLYVFLFFQCCLLCNNFKINIFD